MQLATVRPGDIVRVDKKAAYSRLSCAPSATASWR
jgi:hypothetical protein